MTLEELVGQKLVFGIEGPQPTAEEIELFRKTHAGGLILFERNFEEKGTVPKKGDSPLFLLSKLISDLERAAGRRLLVMVDHEGGRVVRFKEGVTPFPDAATSARAGRPDWVRRQGEIEALELRRLGIDLNLAPVLDVLGPRPNPVVGDRSYGNDPELVGKFGRARIEGMKSKGLRSCAKHYPGLGEAVLDPHVELPTVQKNWNSVKRTDLLPFIEAFEVPVDCVMSTHVVYPQIEPEARPATFSRRLIHDLLRLEFGYSGVVLTDDLKMGAISKSVSLREAVPLTARAGHDLLLVCSDRKSQEEAFDALVGAYQNREIKISELEESVERISRLKEGLGERFSKGPAVPEEDGRALATKMLSPLSF